MSLTPFHIAVQVRDIDEAREFYGYKMGLSEGRSASDWIDFDMFGHQFVVHLNRELGPDGSVRSIANAVDGQGVCLFHIVALCLRSMIGSVSPIRPEDSLTNL